MITVEKIRATCVRRSIRLAVFLENRATVVDGNVSAQRELLAILA